MLKHVAIVAFFIKALILVNVGSGSQILANNIQELLLILNLGNASINKVLHMVLYDHQTTNVRILLVLIELFLLLQNCQDWVLEKLQFSRKS